MPDLDAPIVPLLADYADRLAAVDPADADAAHEARCLALLEFGRLVQRDTLAAMALSAAPPQEPEGVQVGSARVSTDEDGGFIIDRVTEG